MSNKPFYLRRGVVITADELTAWHTTFAIRFAELKPIEGQREEAARRAAIEADTAVEYLRAEIALRERA
jgi:hypothetical protein